MEKKTVFIKRFPSKGELPIIKGKEYLTDRGKMYDYVIHPNWGNIEYWLEEIELPSEEEILASIPHYRFDLNLDSAYKDGYRMCANYILNKLKGE